LAILNNHLAGGMSLIEDLTVDRINLFIARQIVQERAAMCQRQLVVFPLTQIIDTRQALRPCIAGSTRLMVRCNLGIGSAGPAQGFRASRLIARFLTMDVGEQRFGPSSISQRGIGPGCSQGIAQASSCFTRTSCSQQKGRIIDGRYKLYGDGLSADLCLCHMVRYRVRPVQSYQGDTREH